MTLTPTTLRTAALITGVLSFGLVGCTSTTTTSAPTSSGMTLNQEPSPTTSPSPVGSAPTSPTSVTTSTPAWNVAHDSGPAIGAHGQVTKNEAGVPVRYVVASGDTAGGVCNRLHVRWWQLKSGASFLGTYPVLAIGEVIDIVNVPKSAAGDAQSSNALC